MKKRNVNLFPAAAASVIILLLAVCLRFHRPAIRFKFLDGVEPSWQGTQGNMAVMRYHLDCDLSRVCIEGAEQLTRLGYESHPVFTRGAPAVDPKVRVFTRRGYNETAIVVIQRGRGGVLVEIYRRPERFSFRKWLDNLLRRNKPLQSPNPVVPPPPELPGRPLFHEDVDDGLGRLWVSLRVRRITSLQATDALFSKPGWTMKVKLVLADDPLLILEYQDCGDQGGSRLKSHCLSIGNHGLHEPVSCTKTCTKEVRLAYGVVSVASRSAS